MLVPINWLNDFIDIQETPNILVEKLLEHSCEIEEIINKSKDISNVFVGRILAIDKHPDADKLVVCQLDMGKEKLQIVTGATNVKVGDVVPVAVDGAKLPKGIQIKTSKLRGVLSQGMLCSEVELNLAQESAGIFILPRDVELGISVIDYLKLDEVILNLNILPNRADLMSIQGVARELSAVYRKPVNKINISELPVKDGRLRIVNEAPELCQRYIGVVINNVKIGSSPEWLQKRLKDVNIKPINNIVDVTNYVMMELGQPLHAFTYSLIDDSQITIRKAKDDEEMTLLNDEILKLNSTHLIIADKHKPIALAGVMGGKYSSIMEDTANIVLEAACFDAVSVRRAAFSLGLRTESSQRFEKGVDFNNVEIAIRRAILLILELAGGEVTQYSDVKEKEPKKVAIKFRPKRINELLGTNLEKNEMLTILTCLGFVLQDENIIVPSYRAADVYREADLVEEIGRFHGYNNISPVLPEINDFSKNCKPISHFSINNKLREMLTGFGANEIVSYSMISPLESKQLYNKKTLAIKYPLSITESVLRPNLLVSLLKNCEYNSKNLVQDLKTFEIGNIFYNQDGSIKEELCCAALFTGKKEKTSFEKSERLFDFPDLKGIVEDILQNSGIKKITYFENNSFPFLHDFRSAEIRIGKAILAIFGEVHPVIQKQYDFRRKLYYFEIFIDNIIKYQSNKKQFKPFSLYPVVKRDVSFWIDKKIAYETIIKVIEQAKPQFLVDIKLADIYDGNKYGEEKINYAFSIIFQNHEATLTEEQVNIDFKKIVATLESKLSLIFA